MRIHAATAEPLFSPASRYLRLLLCRMANLAPALSLAVAAEDTPTTTLRRQSQLVVLDVVVTDKADHPVTNLTQDDFDPLKGGPAGS